MVAWSECGAPDGHPILWFHGSPGSRLDAVPGGLPDAALAAAGIRLIAADRPGYGRSTRLPGRSLTDVADDTAALADDLGIDTFAVIGWSGGAPMALTTAAALGPRVRSVGVLAGLAPASAATVAGLAEADLFAMAAADPQALSTLLAELAALMRADPAAGAMQLLGEHLSEPDLAMVADPAFAAAMATSLAESARADLIGYADDLVAIGAAWPYPLAAVAQPVMVVHGRNDLIVPLEHGRAIAAGCPDAVLRETDDGHLSVVTHVTDLATTLVVAR